MRTIVGVGALLVAAGGCGVESELDAIDQGLVGPAPDYVVTAVSDPPPNVLNGAKFSITAVVQNAGTADATNTSKTRYFLSLDAVVGGDRAFDQMTTVPPLAVGAADAQSLVLTIPPQVASGTYFLLACADRLGSVPELDNLNNCTAAPGTVTVTGPDLVVETVSDPPPSLAVGATFSITDTVRNAGTAGAFPVNVNYFLSPQPKRVPHAPRMIVRRTVGPLAVGAANTGTVAVKVPATPPGTYYLVACADIGARVPESNEKNNCTASSGTTGIGPADLVVSSLGAPPAAIMPGDTFSIVDTTTNTGHLQAAASTTRFALSQDELPGDDVALVGARSITVLPAGAESTGSTGLAVDLATPPGEYFVLACADADQHVAEASETNNCRPSATPVTVWAFDTTCGADTGGIVVDAVATSDGFTEIRQGASAELVITGTGLEVATEVRLGEFTATLVSVTSTEVRAALSIPHGTPPGPRMLTVRAPPETGCSRLAAIAFTPFVVSPTGDPDGLGTFASPLTLCAPALPANAAGGDSILLLAGTHTCADLDLAGVAIAGEGAGTTTLAGRLHLGGTSTYPASLRDLTIDAPAPALDLQLEGAGGEASIENVAAPQGGVAIEAPPGSSGHAAVANYVFTGPETGLRLGGAVTVDASWSQFWTCALGIFVGEHAHANLTDVEITSCGTGILTEHGWIPNGTRVRITDCDIGIDLAFPPGAFDQPPFNFVQLYHSRFHDNTIGVRVQDSALYMVDVSITGDDATPRPSDWGVFLTHGKVEIYWSLIADQARAGIEAAVPDDLPTSVPSMLLDEVVIYGGERGVYAHGPAAWCFLEMRSSYLEGQTVAAVSWALDPPCIVDVSHNWLSVSSGYALEDLRTVFSPPYPNIEAVGTELNGGVYAGLIQGPAAMPPDYRIISTGKINFGP